MEAAVADLLPEGAETRFEAVPPTTFDDGADHSHGDEHGHSHADGAHAHSHGSGTEHDHSHDDADHAHGVRTIDGGDDG
jgi:urease accessory protein